MIKLPEDLDIYLLINDFFNLAAPFVGIALTISVGFLILRLMGASK